MIDADEMEIAEVEQTATPSMRVPTALHFFLFLALTLISLLLCEGLVLAVAHGEPVTKTLMDQRLQTMASAGSYLLALAMAWFVMPLVWHRPFLAGIEWNGGGAKARLIVVGLAMGLGAQGVSVFVPHTKELPIEEMFHNPAVIWVLAFFGVVVAPVFEEILFRGFLLPAIAIGYDWMQVSRGEGPGAAYWNIKQWEAGTGYSQRALLVASVVTSLLFALIHAPQLAWTWPALGLLFCVSLVLCAVRIRMRSVAASSLVHGCYNLSVFATLFAVTGGFKHLERM
jgi:membrane protease YdiL (CAAX protease family)